MRAALEMLPLLKDLQCEVQQLSLALLPPLDHLQDGDGSAEIPAQLQHLLVGRLVVLTVLSVAGGNIYKRYLK